jgi:hypothetical protein
MEEHFKRIEAPQGFTKTVEGNVIKLKSENIEIRFTLYDRDNDFTGSTLYKATNGKWYTFDQRGISASFYINQKEDLNAEVEKQIKRAAARIEDTKGILTVPGLSFSITPSQLEKAKELIQRGKVYTLTPGGMGTAYELHVTNPCIRYGAQVAKTETAKFFGVAKLWLVYRDHD